jgi:hypothetical protein
MSKIAKIRIEATQGNFMLSKVYDIETGLLIPVRSIKIEMGVHNYQNGIVAILEVPIQELDIISSVEIVEVKEK